MFRTYTITEYNSFVSDSTISKEYVSMNYSDFVCLENFILSNSQVADFMNISFKKNIGKIISVKNYVGTIFINHQFSIEILPKIYTYQNDIVSTKKVLLNMLKNLSDMPFKSFQKAFLQVDKLPMLDIFAIIPDIVLTTPTDTIILDTKWKMLNPKLINYGISQQDMYQMYVYAKKYNSKKVILIYPLSNDEFKNKDISWFTEDISIQVKFIEL